MVRQNLLFVCFANTCRSPMAEAIGRKIAQGRSVVFSAGLRPTAGVAPLTLQALEDLGYSTDGLRPKGLEEVALDEMDVVVSLMGPDGLAGIPRWFSAERISWSIRDPYGEDFEAYLSTARILERRIRELMGALELDLPSRI